MDLQKQELQYWLNLYDEEEDLDFRNFEKNLSIAMHTNKTLTKRDLIKIIRWKFQGKLIGRGEKFVEMVNNQNEEALKKKIHEALYNNIDENYTLSILKSIDGVGPAVSSVILTLFDPKEFCVLDRHVWNEVFNDDKTNFTIDDYLKLLKEIRKISNKYNMSCRNVEKALFKKNKEKSTNKI